MNRFEELTEKYLDEVLSASEGRELANHLRAEPEAARQFLTFYFQDRVLVELFRNEDLKAIESIMAEIRGEENAFVGSVMQRVREQTPRSVFARLRDRFSRLQNLWRSGFAWSGVGAALLIAFYFFFLRPVVGEPVLLVGQANGVTIEREGRQVAASDRLKLQPNDVLILVGTNAVGISYAPENTRLDLHPGITLKLLDWAKGKRFDLRQGKLEASVARQRPFKPLLVRTPNAEAHVLGTKFTLTATTNRTQLDVIDGRVRLTRTSDGAAVKVGAGDYFVVADGTDMKKALPQTGSLLREIWTGIPGGEVNDLLDHPDYPNRPTHRDLLNTFETPVIQTNNYACRLIGYIHPPVTGDYTFWIASGGYSALWVSPDENPVSKVRIATASGGLPRQWWDASSQQHNLMMPQSPKFRLVAGRSYFIEAVEKTATNSSHLEVAWTIPGAEREIISGEFLSAFKAEGKEKQR